MTEATGSGRVFDSWEFLAPHVVGGASLIETAAAYCDPRPHTGVRANMAVHAAYSHARILF